MRIVSVKVEPVARILAIAYAFFGICAFITYAFGSSDYLTLPVGVLAPLFRLNLNLNLGRAGGLFYNIFLGVAALLSYALTGWITGGVLATFFNVIARRIGGIDAKFVSVANEEAPAEPAV
jgi:hypothetical protein